MKDWLMTLKNAVLFKTEAYQELAGRRDAFMWGFLLIVVVSLLAGLPAFIADLVQAAQPDSESAGAAEVIAEFERWMGNATPYLGSMPEEMRQQVLVEVGQNIVLWTRVANEIAALPTVFPQPVGRVLEALGKYTSRPFASGGLPLTQAALGTWLGYGIWVMLAAKLLGGRGTLVGFFGSTALFAVPFILTALAIIPYVGAVLGLVAFLWGIAIYVKAVAVSHQLSPGVAILVTVLPLFAAIVLALVVATGMVVLFLLGSAN